MIVKAEQILAMVAACGSTADRGTDLEQFVVSYKAFKVDGLTAAQIGRRLGMSKPMVGRRVRWARAAGLLEPAEVRVARCGTTGGRDGHRRRGEPSCELCRAARRLRDGRDRPAGTAPQRFAAVYWPLRDRGFGHRQIAVLLGISESALHGRVARAQAAGVLGPRRPDGLVQLASRRDHGEFIARWAVEHLVLAA